MNLTTLNVYRQGALRKHLYHVGDHSYTQRALSAPRRTYDVP